MAIPHRILTTTLLLTAAALSACTNSADQPNPPAVQTASPASFRDSFAIDKSKLADHGSGLYFILESGYTLTFKSGIDSLIITVLNETKTVDGVKTRIVEERETKNGKLEEVSRNYFAIDPATGDAYYFGESVDMYKGGKITSHEGSWESGKNGAKFGLGLPGNPKLGDKYYQELAKKDGAMDQAQIASLSETITVPAGKFANCLKTKESSAVEADTGEKIYAPKVGLVKDDEFELVKAERLTPTSITK